MFCSDKSNQGGGVAAPVGGKVLGEVLPYLCPDKNNDMNTEITNLLFLNTFIEDGKDMSNILGYGNKCIS